MKARKRKKNIMWIIKSSLSQSSKDDSGNSLSKIKAKGNQDIKADEAVLSLGDTSRSHWKRVVGPGEERHPMGGYLVN